MKKLAALLGLTALAAGLFALFAVSLRAPDAQAQSRSLTNLSCKSVAQGQLVCTYATPWQPLGLADATVIGPSPFVDNTFGAKVEWTVDVHLSTPTGSDMGTIRRLFPGHVAEAGIFKNDNGTASDVSLWSYIGTGLDASTATTSWSAPYLLLPDGGDAGPGPGGPVVTVTCNTTACSAATLFTIQYQRPVNSDSGF